MPSRIIAALAGSLVWGMCCSASAQSSVADRRPEIFAPDVIAAPAGVDCLTFTPDGNTAFFDREASRSVTIMESHRTNGSWSTPIVASFSGTWADHDPAVAPDGSFLVFTSNRPDNAGGKALHGGHLWRVNRRGSGWSKPTHFPDAVNATTHTFAPSIAANGDVYFQQSNPPLEDFHLYRTEYRNGTYLAPSRLELGNPGAHMLDPAIAPDGSFIIFDANYTGKGKPDRLYIAFREGSRWGAPIDMGDALNRYEPWGSHLSPDHRTLYFTSDHVPDTEDLNVDARAIHDSVSMNQGNHGIDHIWSISLAPWLDVK